jgi:hypothetical protein
MGWYYIVVEVSLALQSFCEFDEMKAYTRPALSFAEKRRGIVLLNNGNYFDSEFIARIDQLQFLDPVM